MSVTAEQPVARIYDMKPKLPQGGPAESMVKRQTRKIPAANGALPYACDVVAFGSNTVAAIEFIIGGRAGVNGPAAVILEGDRQLHVVEQPGKRTAWQILDTVASMYHSLRGTRPKQHEIQSHGIGAIRG